MASTTCPAVQMSRQCHGEPPRTHGPGNKEPEPAQFGISHVESFPLSCISSRIISVSFLVCPGRVSLAAILVRGNVPAQIARSRN